MEIDGCNLQEENASCTKAPLLPTPCGMTINLVCVISTIQGCRSLLETEIKKNPQHAIAEGSRERGWQFLSVCWMKIEPLSISEVNAWVLAGHTYLSVPTATQSGSYSHTVWFPACLVTASVQLVLTMLGHIKGEERWWR